MWYMYNDHYQLDIKNDHNNFNFLLVFILFLTPYLDDSPQVIIGTLLSGTPTDKLSTCPNDSWIW